MKEFAHGKCLSSNRVTGYGKPPTEVMSLYVAVSPQVRRRHRFLPMATLTLLEMGKFPKINTVGEISGLPEAGSLVASNYIDSGSNYQDV
jgi:hypothetical protein